MAKSDIINKEISQLIESNPHLTHFELSQKINKEKGLNMSGEAIRKRRQRLGIKRDQSLPTQEQRNQFTKDLLKDGFDGENWSHGWLKNKETSIFIRNETGFMTYEDVKDELIAEMRKHSPKYPVIKRHKITDGHLLVIDPADVHIGKLALSEETGSNYNIQVAKQRCIDGVNGIIEKAQGFPIDKIIFVIGNDILHVDNPFRTTTAGTKQDTDGMWWQIFKEAKNMYVSILENLVTVADVEVVFCPSNHDYASGFMLADSLASWFHKSKNITFNVDIVHRKYIQYGLNLLGFDHGDGAKERDTRDLMADEVPQLWAKTKFRYAYKHHIHHKKKSHFVSGQDFIGVTVEYLRTPSDIDAWHHRNGYRSPKAVEGFIHSKNHGQVCRLTHYF